VDCRAGGPSRKNNSELMCYAFHSAMRKTPTYFRRVMPPGGRVRLGEGARALRIELL